MSTITVKDGTTIYYKDWGSGQPIVFSHGWPLNADAWDAQMLFFGQQGFRVIAHDRRSHGRSAQTWDGNEMNTYPYSALLHWLRLLVATLHTARLSQLSRSVPDFPITNRPLRRTRRAWIPECSACRPTERSLRCQ